MAKKKNLKNGNNALKNVLFRLLSVEHVGGSGYELGAGNENGQVPGVGDGHWKNNGLISSSAISSGVITSLLLWI